MPGETGQTDEGGQRDGEFWLCSGIDSDNSPRHQAAGIEFSSQLC